MPQMPRDELDVRLARFTEAARSHSLHGVALFHSHNVGYLSGFSFIPTERPMAYVASSDGRVALVVPQLEVEHAQRMGGVERGLYDADWGGFRHSDTVVVTEDGIDVLTSAYPRDLDSLIIPV
jgi:Xaa-Pro aminopeptidase